MKTHHRPLQEELVVKVQEEQRRLKQPQHIKKGYVCGPMTGVENHNKEAFENEYARLTALGLDAINPHHITEGMDVTEWKWRDFMRVDLPFLTFCDEVYLLENWDKSEGASFEVMIAQYFRKKIYLPDGNEMTYEPISLRIA